jgi:5-methylcytosine-specific restriction endonuclease McrA
MQGFEQMRPVNKPASNSQYAPPAILTFARGNAQLLKKLTGAALTPGNCKVTLTQVLGWLLKNATGSALSGLSASEQKTLIKVLEERVASIYKTAAAPLTQALGAYCSYCGTGLPGLVEIEHTVPKAPYPTFATEWKGFLLSCGPCNTSKGNDPDRAQSTVWTRMKGPAEQDLYDEIRRRYVWPDQDHTCWLDLPAELDYLDVASNRWVPLTTSHSTDLDNVLVAYDVLNHQVLADINVGGTLLRNVQVAVRVRAVPGKPWADDMIDLVGLNEDMVSPATGTYDRRQMNRTRAWFDALEACRQLSTAKSPQGFDLLWRQVPVFAARSGFYAVWLTVLQQFQDPFGVDCAARFVADTNTVLHFPNTCTTHLP